MTHRMMSLIVFGVPLVLAAPAGAQTLTGSAAGQGDLGVGATPAPATPGAGLGVDAGGSLAGGVGTSGALTGNLGVVAGDNLIASAVVGGNGAFSGTAVGHSSTNAAGAAQGAASGAASGNASVNGQSCASANAAFGLSTMDLAQSAGDCTP
ncbi:MAG TPA: hypothetical protein VK726_27615 [Acetobacteraceae bacterium]|jgi:hypothetical protein|nr:hypothetical protein [Acetobacteraceae bacterium]